MARHLGAVALTLALLALAELAGGAGAGSQYLGRELGALSQLHHGVRGRVFAVDARTLYIQDFHYDGEGPAAYFYVGTGKSVGVGAGSGAARLRDERGGTGPLRRYRGEGLALPLPEGKTLRDLRWLAVWCDDFSVNFGDVSIPRGLEAPRSVRAGALRGVHGVRSDPVVVVDAQTLLLPAFSYDGEAPDAKFWVGRGETPSARGLRIPDEHGSEAPLRRYDNKTIVLTLPGELTVFDIGHIAVWCEAFTVDFGHVALPLAATQHVPPSLRMLGVSPQRRASPATDPPSTTAPPRPRRPLAALPATTYRPAVRLLPGADPTASRAAPRAPLHRREDSPVRTAEDSRTTTPEPKLPQSFQQTVPPEREAPENILEPTEIPQTHSYQQLQSQEIFQEHYSEPSLYPLIHNPVHSDPFYLPQLVNQRAYDLFHRPVKPQPILHQPQLSLERFPQSVHQPLDQGFHGAYQPELNIHNPEPSLNQQGSHHPKSLYQTQFNQYQSQQNRPEFGLHQPQTVVNHPRPSIYNPQIGLQQTQPGLSQPQFDLHQSQIGPSQPQIGLHQSQIGPNQPQFNHYRPEPSPTHSQLEQYQPQSNQHSPSQQLQYRLVPYNYQ